MRNKKKSSDFAQPDNFQEPQPTEYKQAQEIWRL